ncbi:transporter [Mucilaginibacter limnophilus]|uniref:Transporter n=1 Tax=Mucilaginibacter limnophilus TaxID=1932778 RepID=A0A3S2UNT9_9SPHI|nr:transporter [Mucilaginibacter limnophilus]RVU02363.1 transporter [Mucilaginibacter limnophilus]
MKRIITLVLFFVLTITAHAQNKSQFNLFKPTPANEMREFESDRPTIIESPLTVDAGHIMYETDLVKLETQTTEIESNRQWVFNNANIKLGITNSTDFQIFIESYGIEKTKELSTGERETMQGFGDIRLRVKQNIIGNDKGNFALSVLPYVKFPTNKYSDNKKYEGGLIVPMEVKLPGEWKLELQVEADRLKDDDDDAYHTELMQGAGISHKLGEKLEAFAETYYTYDFKEHNIYNFLNAELQFEVSDHFLIDGGVYYGIQKHATHNYFAGAAFRF